MRHALVLLAVIAVIAVVAQTRSATAAPDDQGPPDKESTPAPDQPATPPPDDQPEEPDVPLIFIERIDITGNTTTADEIIRRALPIDVGDVLHADDQRLTELKFKVLALGYFRSVTVAMTKGTERGKIVVKIDVTERGTIALNRLWFGTNSLSPYWLGADVTERNLLGLGIAVSGAFVYASHGDVEGSRSQWAGEIRASDASLVGSPLGVNASITLVHGSEPYRVSGADDDTGASTQNAFSYRRFGVRGGLTYDVTPLSRVSANLRAENISAALPVAPTQVLPDGRVTSIDLHLAGNDSDVVTTELGFDRDTRPDPVLPHTGGRITIAAELGTQLIGSSYDFAAFYGRYEHWWPFREDKHALGLRLAGGLVIGNAPRFDRIYIADVDRLLTPRALGLVLSTAGPLDLLGTRSDKPSYGDLGASATIEYTIQLFRGTGKNRIYGGDLFFGAGVWGLAERNDLVLRDTSLWKSLPVDLFGDAGVRLDTDVGVFELTIANALGRLR
ncbi:MAG TPA: BamA/TamA family outer membrane protein [Kofleriaceae bacterium]|jgi:outer membrane protein assembly factor BamA|nr:BamA/TamA family outer membrane protein [Kofleriaceae bacterium]